MVGRGKCSDTVGQSQDSVDDQESSDLVVGFSMNG